MNPIKFSKQYTVAPFPDCTYMIYNNRFVKLPTGPSNVWILIQEAFEASQCD